MGATRLISSNVFSMTSPAVSNSPFAVPPATVFWIGRV